MLGRPVVRCLLDHGHRVRILVRDIEKARRMLGESVEIAEGTAFRKDDIRSAMAGCDAVHLSLPQKAELTAMQFVVDLAPESGVKRITYVSATTACEENRWFEVIDVKMRTEEILRRSGIANIVFCPTWVMEVLPNFVHGNQVTVILGKNPPKLHFFAGADFGRMVASSYADERALGKRLFVHGPEGITLPDALSRFASTCHPQFKVKCLKLWQARLFAKLTGREGLSFVNRLIGYFDKVGELGDPAEANALLGAPSILLQDWCSMRQEGGQDLLH
jgi:uncharacterized protein YbjT (DUF2867 family)